MLPGVSPPPGPPTPPATPPSDRPRWLVCEDGTEYSDRLQRFLGTEFRFERVTDAAALLAATTAAPAAGVIMDLDFRRTPDELLVDEHGGGGHPLAPEERSRLTEAQGIFVLRALRRAGCRLPAILCADLEDPAQIAFLERTLSPLAVAPSSESITALARRLRGG
jgi:hypothetical protein